jgi:hypothetical protein
MEGICHGKRSDHSADELGTAITPGARLSDEPVTLLDPHGKRHASAPVGS